MARGRVPPGTWGPWRSLPVLAILLLVGLLASRPAGAWLRTIGDRFVSEPPTVVPEVHLVRSARPLSPIEPGPFLGTYVAGRSAQLIRPLINRQANVFSQWDPQSSPLSLDRVGVHFSPTPQSTLGSSMPFGPRDYPMEPVPSLSGQPALMGIQPDSLVLVLGSGEYTHQVGTFSVLAASAIDENLVELLIRRDDIGDIMFAWLQANDLHLSLVHPPAQMDLAGIRAAAGLGGNFHMWHGEYYGRVLLTPVSAPATGLADSPGRPEAQTLQQAIVSATSTSAWPGLAGSRFLDVRPTRLVPGNVEDTVALLDSGMVVICRGGHLADCASPLVIGLPGQLSASARLMVPSPKDLAGQAIAWLQVYDPPPSGQAPVIWHAVLVPGRGDFIRWLKLVLPPGAGSAEPSLRPIRLASSDPTSSNWVLASKWIFLDPVAFRCDTDRSIICSTPGNVLSNADGWKCAPGRELSFLAGQEELCAGCAAGWMLTQAPSGQRQCVACQDPHCRTCVAGGCLVCQEGYLLELDPSSEVPTCVTGCRLGFRRNGSLCQPAQASGAPVGVELSSAPTAGGGGGSAVERLGFLAPTRLVALHRPGHETVLQLPEVIPPGGPAHYLGFPADPNVPPRWMKHQQPDPATLDITDLPSTSFHGLGPSILHYVELEPMVVPSQGGSIGAVFCTAQSITLARFVCLRPGVPEAPGLCDTRLTLQTAVNQPCAQLRALDSQTVLASVGSSLYMLTVEPETLLVALVPWVLLVPVRFPGPDGWPDLWMRLHSAGPTHQEGYALDLVALARESDMRLEGLTSVVARRPGEGVGHWPALFAATPGRLAHASGAGEVFLSGVQVPSDAPTGPAYWEAIHLPLGAVPHGRTSTMVGNSLLLAELPDGAPLNYQVLAVPLGDPEHPAALVLLTSNLLGVSVLRCSIGSGFCHLQPGQLFDLPHTLPSVATSSLVPVSDPGLQSDAPGLKRRHRASFLLALDHADPYRVDLQVEYCPEGTFEPECLACHGRCMACTGPGPDECSRCRLALHEAPDACLDACPAGLHANHRTGMCDCPLECALCGPIGGPQADGAHECTLCQAGFALAQPGVMGPCLPCHRDCAECAVPSARADSCTRCRAGRILVDGACLDACPEGRWLDAQAQACRPCLEGCKRCTSPWECDACLGGHFRSPVQAGACRRCDPSCEWCSDVDSCLACWHGLVFLDTNPMVASLCGSTCAPGEYVGTARCMACGPTCALCAGAGDACEVCAAGHRWSGAPPAAGATGTCVPCPDGCDSCTASRCLVCEQGLFLDRHEGCVQACPPGTYNDGPTGTCQPCDVSCAACAGGLAGECTGCAAGLELVATEPGLGTCESGCPEGQYRDRVSGECLGCDPACATCNGPTDKDCWQCTGQVLQDGECVQTCAGQHVALAGRCLPCHPSCEACSGVRSTECVGACPAGLQALPAGQTPMRCVAGCPVGYNTSAGGCSPCGSSCASCPLSAEQCVQCERGRLLSSAVCVSACPEGTLAQGGLCAGCAASCATCFGPARDQCLTCAPEWPLLLEGACLSSCPEGTTEEGGSCVPCPVGCSACTDPATGQCSVCRASWVLLAGTCVESCPPGQYAADAELGGQVCRACDGTCLECSGPGPAKCSACPPGLMLHEGRCEGSCPAGMFECLLAGRCEACPAGCTACTVAEESPVGCAAACSACQGGLFLSFATGECLPGCPLGEYAPAGLASCAPCQEDCMSCHQVASLCTSCRRGLLLEHMGACVAACPGSGFSPEWLPSPVCRACAEDCDRCTAGPSTPACDVAPSGALTCPMVDTCDRCSGDRLLLGGVSCVPTCPEGFFADHEAPAPACVPCHSGCGTCVGPGLADCLDRRDRASRRGLALGLGIGLGLLALLLLLAGLAAMYLRHGRSRSGRKGSDHLEDDVTVLNTIIELSLPGSIQVSISSDFTPLPGEQLGTGTQATVYAARAVGAGISDRLGCPAVVAIKRLKADRLRPSQLSMFHNEVALMWLLREHPGIVRLYGYSEAPPALVMERFQTDLGTLLHSEAPLTEPTVLDIVRQWATGLEAMHAQGMAHCDLKPGNVFLSLDEHRGSWRAALGDLGTSRNLSADRTSVLVAESPALNAMTARYAAPEVLTAFHRRRPLDRELYLPADIFAAAVMLWECLHRALPWKGADFQTISESVRAGARPEVSAPLAAGPLGDLLQLAWHADPGSRPLSSSFRQKCAMAAALEM